MTWVDKHCKDKSLPIRYVMAVSYTHLDVYKRQQLKDGLIRAKNTRSVLMLLGHRPLFTPSEEPYAFSVQLLEEFLQDAQRMGLKSYTMLELVTAQ